MHTFSEETKQGLEKTLGTSVEELQKKSPDEERKWVEEKIGKSWFFLKGAEMTLSKEVNYVQ